MTRSCSTISEDPCMVACTNECSDSCTEYVTTCDYVRIPERLPLSFQLYEALSGMYIQTGNILENIRQTLANSCTFKSNKKNPECDCRYLRGRNSGRR
ncbi:hypothetical protein SNEBB_006977 [Seison nebaliae]|nr:hypothetical protein SNEBB_006977 [Seison nebaliae]